jgi:predicted HTH transcriptional regulator
MNFSETVIFDRRNLTGLQKLVREGEGLHLEFKRKVAYPEKVILAMMAFANTDGGTLLVGVDDDGRIPGVKYPEEETLSLIGALQKHCRPVLTYHDGIIPLSEKRFVLRFDVPASPLRPHFFIEGKDHKTCYVRVGNQSLKASREVAEIVRRSKKKKDIRFSFGPSEKQLMEYLEEKGSITLREFRTLAGLNRFLAAKKLVLLVLANVLQITPAEKGDVYSRIVDR